MKKQMTSEKVEENAEKEVGEERNSLKSVTWAGRAREGTRGAYEGLRVGWSNLQEKDR